MFENWIRLRTKKGSVIYGTLLHIADFYNDQHWWNDYSWTASNGNKFTNLVEVLEGESIDFNNDLFKKISEGTYVGFYTIKGDDSSKLDDVYTPNGNDMVIYGKFGSQITFMNENNQHAKLLAIYGPEGNQVQALPGNPVLGTYTFRNWWTAKNGGGTQFTLATKQNTNLTVYAKWVSVISYNFNGNGGTNGTVDVLKGNTWKTPTVTAGSYTFRNWWTSTNFTGTSYTAGQTITPTGNLNIYAKWVSVITYNNNGAGSAVGNKEVIKGQTLAQAGAYPTLSSNYTFKGWSTSNPTGNSYSTIMTSWVPTGNSTLYAVWVSVITFNGYVNIVLQFLNGRRDTVEVLKGQSINSGNAGGIYNNSGSNAYYRYYHWKKESGYGTDTIKREADFTPTGNAIYTYDTYNYDDVR